MQTSSSPSALNGKPAEHEEATSFDPARFATSAPSEPSPDPFDPAALRLGQNFGDSIAVKRVITTIPCKKPDRQAFVRVRPGEEWRLETAALEDKINRETYLLDRRLWSELASEVYPVALFTAITRQGDVFLWPAKLPGADGKSNPWNESALAATKLAESKWVRMSANMGAGMYDVFEAAGELAEPTWPELSFQELLRLCFKDRFISTNDHPILRALRGEV